MRAVVFAAVSTTSQAAEDRYSLPQQLEACRGVAASFGWDVVKEIEVRGHSRRYRWLFELTADCPEYGELVDLVRGERTDIIVVRDYDRLWRTDSLRGQLCALCEEHHVQIFSVNQPTQVETPAALRNGVKNVAAHWLQAVLGIVSEGENELRIVRLRAGRAGRIAAGKQCTGTAPFGYRLTGIPGDVMQVNPDEAPWVRWMFEQIAEGATYPSIAATLNTRGVPTAGATRHGWATVWTRQTVRAICANSHYVGMVHLGKHEAQGQHEALIDRQLWDAVQVVRRSAGAGLPAHPRRWDHILRGVVAC
jgi:DNA invertase Pin-like site-specific DNA recombinase